MNSENEKLRGLLQQALDMLEEQALHIEAPMLPAGGKLLNQIRAALAEHVEPAPAQDEREAFDPIRDIARQLGITTLGDGLLAKIRETIDLLRTEAHNFAQYREFVNAYSPAQPEQKPAAWKLTLPDGRVTLEKSYPSWAEGGDGYAIGPLYAAMAAQGVQSGMAKALQSIFEMTDADDVENYRYDDREGCLNAVHALAGDALAAQGGE